MEFVFVVVIAACLGAIVRYTIPGRDSHGAALLPAVSTAVTATVWVGLLWLGWTFDGGWIWAVSLIAGPAAAVAAAISLPPARARADEQLLHELSGGRA